MTNFKLKFNAPVVSLALCSPLGRMRIEDSGALPDLESNRLNSEALLILRQISQRLDALESELQAQLQHQQREILSKAAEIAQMIVQSDEILIQSQLENFVRSCLGTIPATTPRSVHVHPDYVTPIQIWLKQFGSEPITVHPDASLAPGDCRVESAEGGVAATLEAFLETLPQLIQSEK